MNTSLSGSLPTSSQQGIEPSSPLAPAALEKKATAEAMNNHADAFSDAIKTMDAPRLDALLADHPVRPRSPMEDFPLWCWVVNNAVLRLDDRQGLRAVHLPHEIAKKMNAQLAVLARHGVDATEQLHDRNGQDMGGPVHRLLLIGSVKAHEGMPAVAQAVLEGVPEAALALRNGDGFTARGLLDSMTKPTAGGSTYRNLDAFEKAFSARAAKRRQDRTPPLILDSGEVRSRRSRLRRT